MTYWRHMRKKAIAAIAAAAVLAPALAFAMNFNINFVSGGVPLSAMGGACQSYICWLGGEALFVINGILVPVLFAIAFIVFIYGVAKAYIITPEKRAEGHKLILWGLIGFVVMLSVWGLVNAVSNTFGLAGGYAPPIPVSPLPTKAQ